MSILQRSSLPSIAHYIQKQHGTLLSEVTQMDKNVPWHQALKLSINAQRGSWTEPNWQHSWGHTRNLWIHRIEPCMGNFTTRCLVQHRQSWSLWLAWQLSRVCAFVDDDWWWVELCRNWNFILTENFTFLKYLFQNWNTKKQNGILWKGTVQIPRVPRLPSNPLGRTPWSQGAVEPWDPSSLSGGLPRSCRAWNHGQSDQLASLSIFHQNFQWNQQVPEEHFYLINATSSSGKLSSQKDFDQLYWLVDIGYICLILLCTGIKIWSLWGSNSIFPRTEITSNL